MTSSSHSEKFLRGWEILKNEDNTFEDYHEALTELMLAVAIEPDYNFAHFALGLAHEKMANYCQFDVSDIPNNVDKSLEEFVNYNYESAVSKYLKAAELSSDNSQKSDILCKVAMIYAEKMDNQDEKSIDIFKKAFRLNPTNQDINAMLGQCLYRSGKKDEGLRILTQASRKGSELAKDALNELI